MENYGVSISIRQQFRLRGLYGDHFFPNASGEVWSLELLLTKRKSILESKCKIIVNNENTIEMRLNFKR